MNNQALWATAKIILTILNTLAFTPVFFYLLLLLIRAPKTTLDYITVPLLFFTVSVFVLNFIASAWQFDHRRGAAKLLLAAGGLLVMFSVVLLYFN